ncbi:hypothetical protein HOC35_00265 [Candidatus Woesearchaeota archaeon]|jgi:hypothetical protein|nr:hypothetical protein [Candidatus Woesearchaeota archaeon]
MVECKIFNNPTHNLSMEQLDELISATTLNQNLNDWIIEGIRQQADIVSTPHNPGRVSNIIPDDDLEKITSGLLDSYHNPDFIFKVRGDNIELVRNFDFHPIKGIEGYKKNHNNPILKAVLDVLFKYRERNISFLEDAYRKIAAYQTPFLSSLKTSDLKPLSISKIAKILDLPEHSTTYFRMLSNRFIGIDSDAGKVPFFPAMFMAPKDHLVSLYTVADEVNKYLRTEFEKNIECFNLGFNRGIAYSDQEISSLSGKLARRTIAKYRLLANIPDNFERVSSYKKRDRTSPYMIRTLTDIYIHLGKHMGMEYEENKNGLVSVDEIPIPVDTNKIDHRVYLSRKEFNRNRNEVLMDVYKSMQGSDSIYPQIAETGLFTKYNGAPLTKLGVMNLVGSIKRNSGGN